jgi:hypothetical protein
MQALSTWPERQARLLRWLLLIGWLLLILSLLVPGLHLPAELRPSCPPQAGDCTLHHQPGNRLFWGTLVPSGVLLIAAGSHELWRRICPLAFVSQLFRALGLQRTAVGRGGRAEVVKVTPDSWLGRHHLQLQWSLLIAGLCLRLLVVNSSPVGLALLLIGTLMAALLVGWAYGGKAWCQYVCPMAPVQAVLTGPRGPLGSTAHLGTRSRLTQSMCRTVGESGREQSTCIACQAPCLDIDAERAYWQTIQTKRGLTWAWYSYPGLVIGFFLLLEQSRPPGFASVLNLTYLRSGLWAFDAGLPARSLDPLAPLLPLPRLLGVPALLVLAGGLSALLFEAIEHRLRPPISARTDQPAGQLQLQLAASRTRLLASFVAVNGFFWFTDPSQGAIGPAVGQLIRSAVLAISAIWLFRSWGRDPSTYRRESTSESLRKQLHDLPGLQEALDGRSLQELSPQEVFTLAKALPAVTQQRSLEIYRGVLADMLRSGRLERGQALLQLQDLREVLKLKDEDHHNALRRLAGEQPNLLQLDWRELQSQDLRLETATAALQELMATAGLEVLEPNRLRPALQQRLDQLRKGSGLSETAWQELLGRYGPRGHEQQRRLERDCGLWMMDAGLQRLLDQQAAADHLYRPLARAMAMRVQSMAAWLTPRLEEAGLPPLPVAPLPIGGLDDALDLLWQDPDPDTAGWVLLLRRCRTPEALQRQLAIRRMVETSSPFLESQRRGGSAEELRELLSLAAAPLFADLLPSGLVWLMRQGSVREWPSGAVVFQAGDISRSLSVVIDGEARLNGGDGQALVLGPGVTVGEMGVITGNRRSRTVTAGPEGLLSFELPGAALEELLSRSRSFSMGLLRLLALRVSDS